MMEDMDFSLLSDNSSVLDEIPERWWEILDSSLQMNSDIEMDPEFERCKTVTTDILNQSDAENSKDSKLSSMSEISMSECSDGDSSREFVKRKRSMFNRKRQNCEFTEATTNEGDSIEKQLEGCSDIEMDPEFERCKTVTTDILNQSDAENSKDSKLSSMSEISMSECSDGDSSREFVRPKRSMFYRERQNFEFTEATINEENSIEKQLKGRSKNILLDASKFTKRRRTEESLSDFSVTLPSSTFIEEYSSNSKETAKKSSKETAKKSPEDVRKTKLIAKTNDSKPRKLFNLNTSFSNCQPDFECEFLETNDIEQSLNQSAIDRAIEVEFKSKRTNPPLCHSRNVLSENEYSENDSYKILQGYPTNISDIPVGIHGITDNNSVAELKKCTQRKMKKQQNITRVSPDTFSTQPEKSISMDQENQTSSRIFSMASSSNKADTDQSKIFSSFSSDSQNITGNHSKLIYENRSSDNSQSKEISSTSRSELNSSNNNTEMNSPIYENTTREEVTPKISSVFDIFKRVDFSKLNKISANVDPSLVVGNEECLTKHNNEWQIKKRELFEIAHDKAKLNKLIGRTTFNLNSSGKKCFKLKKPAVTKNVVLTNKKPKLYSKETWITKNLYDFIQSRLAARYGPKTTMMSEKFMIYLADQVKYVINENSIQTDVRELKETMARLNIIQTNHEFYQFCHEYMPFYFCNKVLPKCGGTNDVHFDATT